MRFSFVYQTRAFSIHDMFFLFLNIIEIIHP